MAYKLLADFVLLLYLAFISFYSIMPVWPLIIGQQIVKLAICRFGSHVHSAVWLEYSTQNGVKAKGCWVG